MSVQYLPILAISASENDVSMLQEILRFFKEAPLVGVVAFIIFTISVLLIVLKNKTGVSFFKGESKEKTPEKAPKNEFVASSSNQFHDLITSITELRMEFYRVDSKILSEFGKIQEALEDVALELREVERRQEDLEKTILKQPCKLNIKDIT